MNMDKIAIVGIFYDGYYDLWEDFLALFKKYWQDCPYPLYIVNNEKELEFEENYDVKVIHAGKDAEYSKKVQVAINNIEADYLLLLLEDFYIGEKIETEKLVRLISSIQKKDIKYYRMPMREFTPVNLKNKIRKITTDMEYTVSCQPSIWKKSFLKECIGTENYNAWVFEGIYTKSPKAHTEAFLNGCYVDYNNPLHLWHGALQGKILPGTYEHFKHEGYTFKNGREILSKAQERKNVIKFRLKCLIPLKVQRFIKKHKKSSSVVEKYNTDILKLMHKMNLD